MIKTKNIRLNKVNFNRTFCIMKLFAFFLIMSIGVCYAESSYSQETRLSIKLNNKTVKQVLSEIEKNSEFVFIYQENSLNTNRKVSVDIEDKTVDKILDEIFESTDNSYKISGRQIYITKNPKSAGSRELKVSQDDKNTVRGTILDEKGQPLPGVAISVKGTTRGVLSDINGYYIIEAKSGETLVFSFIGFKTQEINIGNSQSLNVILIEDIQELEEAVVVGMGTQRKASVIGSISSVSARDLRMPQRSLTANLSGRISGTIAVQRSGEPGQDIAQFWVRGLSTFGSNKTPLMLVDGVERDINDISMEEIESFSVLKDASATAVYGVRAANGVVLVTTRKGVAQKPTIELKLEYGISDLPRMPKFLDGPNYAKLYNEAFGKTTYTDEYISKLTNYTGMYDPYLYPNVNWFDEVFKDYSNNMNASLNVTGGSELVRYFVSASYLEDNGNLKDWKANDYKSNIQFKRYNFRSNVDLTLSKTTTLNLEIGANLIDNHQPGIGNQSIYGKYVTPAEEVFYWAYLSTPLSSPVRVPIKTDPDGYAVFGWGAPTQVGEKNPAERLFGSGYSRNYRTQAMSQAVLTQQLPFILDGLEFKGAFSFDYTTGSFQKYTKNSSTYGVRGLDQVTGELLVAPVDVYSDALNYTKTLSSSRAIELKLQLIYNKVFNDKHRVGGMFMFYRRNFIDSAASSNVLSLPYRKQGLAARATYSYDDRYFAEFNVGYNGSENFPKSKRYGVFPAGAIGYLISNESFWKFEPINVLKLRGSIGLVGNESLATDRNGNTLRFGYLDLYDGGFGGFNWGLNENTTSGVAESQYGVRNLTWEKGLKKNVGIELKMFNSKVSLDFDYFHENRRDILIVRNTIPGFAGFGTASINANIGKVRNHGIDGTLEVNHRVGQVDFRLYGNYTFTRNKILKMDEAEKKYRYTMRTGNPIGQQMGYVAVGLFKDQDDIDTSPSQATLGNVRPGDVKYLDYNGDGVINTDDMKPIGYSNIPEVVYGFGTQIVWKNFDFGIFFRGQDRVTYALGGFTYVPFSQGVGKGNLFEKALDRWTPENPRQDAFYPRLSDGASSNNNQASTRNIYNGRLLRLSDLEIGYTFDKKLIAPLGIKSLRVYVLGNNVALISKWKLWDPETGTQNGDKYPLTRKFNFGIRTTF